MTKSRHTDCPPTYHFAEIVRQLFNHHAESLELLEHADNVAAREPTDGLGV